MRVNRMTVATVLAAAACGANAQLLNPNFEMPGGLTTFANWTSFGNVFAELDAPIEGVASVSMFGGFPGEAVILQDITGVQPGDVWQAGLSGLTPIGDSIAGTENFFLFAAVFIDSSGIGGTGGNLIGSGLNLIDGDTPEGELVSMTTEPLVAPLGVDTVQFVAVFVQPDGIAGGSIDMDLASLELIETGAEIPFYNPSFELDGEFQRPFDGWRDFGNSIGNIQLQNSADNPAIPPAFDGDQYAFIFGQFNGDVDGNDSGIFQGQPAAPGEEWEASVWVRNNEFDPIGEGNFGFLDLVFIDANGDAIPDSSPAVEVASAATPTGVWEQFTLSDTAPAGTVEAQIVLVYSQAPAADGIAGNEPAGSILFDLTSLAIAEPGGFMGCNPADVNEDGTITFGDVSAFISAFNEGDSAPVSDDGDASADTTGDGMVNFGDVSAFIAAFNSGEGCP